MFPATTLLPRHLSIRLYLAGLAAACLVPVWLAGGYLLHYSYHAREALIERHMLETARSLKRAVDQELTSMQATMRSLATSPAIDSGDLATFHAQAIEVLADYPASDIVMADASGQQFINTFRPFGSELPTRSNLDAVRRVFETGRPIISDLFKGAVTGRALIGVDVPVFRDGRVAYDLAMTAPAERLSSLLAQQDLPPGWIGTILDSRLVVAARTRTPEQFVGQPAAALAILRGAVSGAEGTSEGPNLEGAKVIAGFSRSAVSDWTVVITVPTAILMADLWRWMAWVATGAAVLSLAGIGLALGLGRRVARSINSLVAPALALGRGEPVVGGVLELKETSEVREALAKASLLLQQRTEEREQADALRRRAEDQATVDSLTGVFNRYKLNDILQVEIARASRYGTPLSVVMFDVDHFKRINDTHGHQAGDSVLVELTGLIAGQIRQADFLARWGGDEFMVVLPQMTADESAMAAERWRVRVGKHQFAGVGRLSCCFGVAESIPGDTPELLTARADQALYHAKDNGRNRVSGHGQVASA